jgi:hypothetical protein
VTDSVGIREKANLRIFSILDDQNDNRRSFLPCLKSQSRTNKKQKWEEASNPIRDITEEHRNESEQESSVVVDSIVNITVTQLEKVY